jgi:hypothetical protein
MAKRKKSFKLTDEDLLSDKDMTTEEGQDSLSKIREQANFVDAATDPWEDLARRVQFEQLEKQEVPGRDVNKLFSRDGIRKIKLLDREPSKELPYLKDINIEGSGRSPQSVESLSQLYDAPSLYPHVKPPGAIDVEGDVRYRPEVDDSNRETPVDTNIYRSNPAPITGTGESESGYSEVSDPLRAATADPDTLRKISEGSGRGPASAGAGGMNDIIAAAIMSIGGALGGGLFAGPQGAAAGSGAGLAGVKHLVKGRQTEAKTLADAQKAMLANRNKLALEDRKASTGLALEDRRQEGRRELLGTKEEGLGTRLGEKDKFDIAKEKRSVGLYSEKEAIKDEFKEKGEGRAEIRDIAKTEKDQQFKIKMKEAEVARKKEISMLKSEDDLFKYRSQQKITKDSQAVIMAYNRIATINPEKATSSDDIALVYNFMRMQDPTSTVREGEYATAENSAGWSDRMRVQYNKAVDGQRLTPIQRKRFIATGKTMYEAQRKSQKDLDEGIRSRAIDLGLDPDRVIKSIGFEDASVKVGGKDFQVGEIVEQGGVKYKITKDGKAVEIQ